MRVRLKKILKEQSGAGVVEMVLILVVLISLVIIFKSQLTALLNLIFEQIQSAAGSVF
jgi:Flp pilus assembly pilin Flp